MGILKTGLKLVGSAALGAAGVASAILQNVAETAGGDGLAELSGAIKTASFNGIRNMWDLDTPAEEEYATEEEAKQAAIDKEIHKLKVQALRCREMAEKATSEEARQKFMDRHDSLREQATDLESHRYDAD